MKVNIKVTYAGQTKVFENIEFDDENLTDVSIVTGKQGVIS